MAPFWSILAPFWEGLGALWEHFGLQWKALGLNLGRDLQDEQKKQKNKKTTKNTKNLQNLKRAATFWLHFGKFRTEILLNLKKSQGEMKKSCDRVSMTVAQFE